MCKLSIGQQVNLTGRIFCKFCGQVLSQGGTLATFVGHDGGFDVFDFNTALICPWCSTTNEECEKPCEDPIVLVVEKSKVDATIKDTTDNEL